MKKLIYLGIILMIASCGSDEVVTDPSNESESYPNESETSEDNTPDVKVCLDDAFGFMYERCSKIGQEIIGQNVTKNDGSYLYYFMSAPLDRSSICISVISEHKLEIISTNCGDPYDKQEQWKYIQWCDDPCNTKDATIKLGELEVMTEDLGSLSMSLQDAKKALADLGDGWRLPTKDELNLLYENKEKIGGFAEGIYVSSSEFDSNNLWCQFFGNGVQAEDDKSNDFEVRAVRSIE
jgi:hypothetical protein